MSVAAAVTHDYVDSDGPSLVLCFIGLLVALHSGMNCLYCAGCEWQAKEAGNATDGLKLTLSMPRVGLVGTWQRAQWARCAAISSVGVWGVRVGMWAVSGNADLGKRHPPDYT